MQASPFIKKVYLLVITILIGQFGFGQNITYIYPNTIFEETVPNSGLIFLAGDQTWTKEQSPILVHGQLYIPEGNKLTVEKGVIIGIDSHHSRAKIIVEGTLVVKGEEGDPVVFTSTLPLPHLKWGGIEIQGDNASVDITYLLGQMAEKMIHFNSSSTESLRISHSYFRANHTAIEFSKLRSNIRIQNNYISNNDYGIVLNTPIPEKRIIHNQILNNNAFDLFDRSGKPINMSDNCWSQELTKKLDRGLDRTIYEVSGENITLKPVNNSCLPIPDLMNLSGGDITVVIDDDIAAPIDLDKKLDFAIYPNPASHQVKITYQNFTPSKLQIINSLGQIIEQIDQLPIREITIPVSHLPAGVYHFRLNTKYGMIQRKVIVVENW